MFRRVKDYFFKNYLLIEIFYKDILYVFILFTIFGILCYHAYGYIPEQYKKYAVNKLDTYVVSYVESKKLALVSPEKYENKIRELKAQKTKLRNESSNYERLNEKYQKRYTVCKDELSQANDSLESKNSDILEFKSNLEQAKSEVITSKEQIKKNKETNDILKRSINSLESKLSDCKGKNDWLRSLEAKHRLEKKEIKERLQNIKENNDILTQKLTDSIQDDNVNSNSEKKDNEIVKSVDIFNGWEFLGMVDDSLVLGKLPDFNMTKIIRPGKEFMGVKITDINIQDKYVQTEKGRWFWNS